MVTYTCYADGGLGNSYQWLRQRDSSVLSMVQELILNNADPLDGDDYQCIITNAAGNTSVSTTLNGEMLCAVVIVCVSMCVMILLACMHIY